jgi:putative thioredoxin
MTMAETALDAGRLEDAARGFRAVLENQPENGDALIGMARVAMGMGDGGAMAGWLDKIAPESPVHSKAVRLRGLLAFSEDAGDINALQAAVTTNAKDADSWYRLGASYALANRFELAFGAFLEVVELDREYREDGGRKALLALFDLVGAEDEFVIKARRRLASLLF